MRHDDSAENAANTALDYADRLDALVQAAVAWAPLYREFRAEVDGDVPYDKIERFDYFALERADAAVLAAIDALKPDYCTAAANGGRRE